VNINFASRRYYRKSNLQLADEYLYAPPRPRDFCSAACRYGMCLGHDAPGCLSIVAEEPSDYLCLCVKPRP